MKTKEYQNVVVNIILLSADCIRTSGDLNETERIPFSGGTTDGASFVQ